MIAVAKQYRDFLDCQGSIFHQKNGTLHSLFKQNFSKFSYEGVQKYNSDDRKNVQQYLLA